MTKTADINWEKAERFYRAGIITNTQIGEKCGCSRQAIERRAKAEGWTRNLQSSIHKVASRKLLDATLKETTETQGRSPEKHSVAPHTISAPVAAPDVHAREREDAALVEAAAREIVSVTQAHRVEAARLIDIARDLGGKLADLVHGRAVAFEAKTKDGSKMRVAFLGDHESVSDALGKVTRALAKLVDIERKAFAMDAPEDNPDAARKDFVPLEVRLAQYRREEVMAEADNVVKLPEPTSSPD